MQLLIAGSSVEDMIHILDKASSATGNPEGASGLHPSPFTPHTSNPQTPNPKPQILNQPGGMFYVASACNALKEEGDRIWMLTGMSENQRHLYFPLYDNFELEFVNHVEQLPVNHLFIHEEGERDEKYENFAQKIEFDPEALSRHHFDGVLLNLITGFDLTPADAAAIRKVTGAPVFLDIHSRSRSFDHDGKRVFAKIDDIAEWLAQVDILQANENEIKYCGDGEEESLIVENILNLGVKIVLVTRSAAGVRMYRRINGETNSLFVKALPVRSVNKVGCGDVFGTAFFMEWLRTGDPVRSLYYANAAGAAVSTYEKNSLITRLKKDVDTLLHEE